MSALLPLLLSLFLLGHAAYIDESQRPENGAYNYQSSFNGPFGGTHIPYWETGGSAIVMDNYIRLTPNQQSQRGWIWTSRPMRSREWEIHVQFAIGSESRVGADGMAVWYTKEKAQPGPVMGYLDRWNGLGIIIDTFDNDGQRDNPQIYAVYNDNSYNFRPATDGKEKTLGICQAAVRQVTATPENKFVRLAIRLKEKMLTVSYDLSALSGSEQVEWTNCFTAPVPIEDQLSGYYIGITAETGGLSDYHDVKSVATWSIRTPVRREEQPSDEDTDTKKRVDDSRRDRDRDRDRDSQNTRDVKDTSKDSARDIPKSKKFEGDDPASEIVNRLLELEKKDEAFSTALESKFKEMQLKLEAMEKDQIQTLNRVYQGLESIRSAVDVNRIEELKSDVKKALTALNNVQSRINSIETHVEGTNKNTADLHGLHDARSTELRELVERSSTWGFWTYFMIFQIFFFGLHLCGGKRHKMTRAKNFYDN